MKIIKILLVIIIILSAILIGSPISYNCLYLNIGIIAIGLVYIMYKLFIKKEKVIDSKLDIFVLILSLSPITPLIFNTYINLEDSVISLVKYISVFMVYIFAKQVTKEDENGLDIITNTIIISSFILCIIGIDNMTTRIFSKYLENIGLPYVINLEKRMFSSLGYANSFAIILAISIIFIIDKITNKKGKKYETIMPILLFVHLACFLLTLSRAVMGLTALVIFIYIILNRKNKNLIYMLYILVGDIILSLIYFKLWDKEGRMFLILLALCFVAFLISKIVQKLYKKIEKIPKKVYMVIIVLSILVVVIAVFIGMKLSVPLTIFTQKDSTDFVKYKIQNIEPNTEYVLKFDIDAKSRANNIKNYRITIEEEDKYYDTVKKHYIEFDNYKGIKEIKFKTTDNTIELGLYISSKYKISQLGLTINKLTVNDLEHPLNYMYLPVSLVDRIKDINVKDKSVWERGTYYYDSLKIIKDSYLTGLGSNAWKYEYKKIQSYDYNTTEVHSYPLQLILENGIISLISFILIIIIVIKKAKNTNVSIILAFLLLTTHSLIDFNMSFFYILLIYFIILGIISNSKQ